jgi:hypothetical protein
MSLIKYQNDNDSLLLKQFKKDDSWEDDLDDDNNYDLIN